MTDSSPSRYTQSLLLALMVHVGILLLLIVSPTFSPPDVEASADIQAVMMAHVAHASPTMPIHNSQAPAEPAPVVPPQANLQHKHSTPPPPIHGEAGIVQHITPPAPVPQRAEITASQVQGPRSPDRVPAIKRPRPSHIDQHQADQELKDIDQEASQLDAQQQKAAIKAAQDAQEQSEANRLAQQQQAQQQANLINTYRNRIIALIKQHWIQPLCAEPSMYVLLQLQLLPDGTVVNVTSLKPNSCLDLSVRNAIDSVARLPVPDDPVLFEHYFRNTKLRFRPLDND